MPVVKTIQSAWPDTKITWIIGSTEYELLKGLNDIEFITLDKSRGIDGYLNIRRRLKGRRFPVLLHMHASMRANIASLMFNADIRLGFDTARARDRQWLFTNRKIPAHPEQHVMDGLFSFIETLGVHERTLEWDIPVSASDRRLAQELSEGHRRLCVISPCTSQRFRNYRNWAADNYVAVAEHLNKHCDARVVLTGGPTGTEREYGQKIQSAVTFPITNLIGQTSLKELLAILESADLLICPDSGPGHMATAVGTPVIGLYATSNTCRTGPYFSQHLVVDEYPKAVYREFGKLVSALRWGQRVRDPNAMNLIQVDDVLTKIDMVLGRQAKSAVDRNVGDGISAKIAPDSGLG